VQALNKRSPRLEDTVLIALAGDRLARAISVDTITAGLRARIDRWANDTPGGPARRTLAELLHCPVCVGWWTTVAMSLVWPGRMRVRRGIAAAGVQVLLTLATRLVSEEGRAAIHEADLAERRRRAIA